MNSLAHLISGFVGEGNSQNAGSGDAMRFDEMGDAVRDDARFAASGAREQQERSFDVRDSRLLLWIQTLEKIHEKGGQHDFNMLRSCRRLS
jgi:hypothetical protein